MLDHKHNYVLFEGSKMTLYRITDVGNMRYKYIPVESYLFLDSDVVSDSKRPKGLDGYLHIMLFVHVSARNTVSSLGVGVEGVIPFSRINSDPHH